MSIEHNYEVNVNWIHDRMGIIYSPELNEEIPVVTPPQFPKGINNLWSPEHLFTAAVNSCLMTTFLSIAENSKLEFVQFSSKAMGKLEMVDGKYMMSLVTLKPVVTIADEESREKAVKVLGKAETACLVSNSIKSTIVFEPEVRVK
ncbi:MAG: OsmC family protein [Bacteroidota bacterium]